MPQRRAVRAHEHTHTRILLLNTQSHTPAALARNHPGQQRSSPVASGGVCQSCWPGTMTSHSCWGHESGSSLHPGEKTTMKTWDKMDEKGTAFQSRKPEGWTAEQMAFRRHDQNEIPVPLNNKKHASLWGLLRGSYHLTWVRHVFSKRLMQLNK